MQQKTASSSSRHHPNMPVCYSDVIIYNLRQAVKPDSSVVRRKMGEHGGAGRANRARPVRLPPKIRLVKVRPLARPPSRSSPTRLRRGLPWSAWLGRRAARRLASLWARHVEKVRSRCGPSRATSDIAPFCRPPSRLATRPGLHASRGVSAHRCIPTQPAALYSPAQQTAGEYCESLAYSLTSKSFNPSWLERYLRTLW